MLGENRPLLEKLAKSLLDRETMTVAEIKTLLKMKD